VDPSHRKPAGFARLLLLLSGTLAGLGLVEGICRLGVEDGARMPETLWGSPLIPKDARDLRSSGRSEAGYAYLRVDPMLGWTLSPGAEVDEGVLYRADAAGLRTSSTSNARHAQGSPLRIAAFGDSFTHCDEVPFEDCWTERLEIDREAAVFNAGVPGYGTDQAYLRYRAMRAELRPDVVILGLMIGDIKRNVNVFRTFLGGWTAWTKPRFVLEGEGLALINQPAASPAEVPGMIASGHPLLERDWWYDPAEWRRDWRSRSVAYRFARARLWRPAVRPSYYGYDSEPTVVTARIVEAFKRDVEAAGGRFLCVLMPSEPHLRYGDPPPWQPLVERLMQAEVEMVDPTAALRERSASPGLFAPGGHYSRVGNEVVAKAVSAALAPPPVVAKSEPSEGIAVAEGEAGLLAGFGASLALGLAFLRRALALSA
jgi:hypothetical protein